jgi:hypothetical protein
LTIAFLIKPKQNGLNNRRFCKKKKQGDKAYCISTGATKKHNRDWIIWIYIFLFPFKETPKAKFSLISHCGLPS